MDRYFLKKSDGNIVKEGSMTEIMKEIMTIAQENSIPEVTYDANSGDTCFEFEGCYCNFKLYLS